jgi:hypothetical protein
MIGCRRWFVGGTKDEHLPHDSATGDRRLRRGFLGDRGSRRVTRTPLSGLRTMGSPLPTGQSTPRPATPGGRAPLPPPPATSSRPVLYGSGSSHAVSILCHSSTVGEEEFSEVREDHSFGGCAPAHLGTIIWLLLSRTSLIPLRGTARLFLLPAPRSYVVLMYREELRCAVYIRTR